MTGTHHFSIVQGATFARTITWKTRDSITDPERTVTDAVTNGTTTVTSATANFLTTDVQREVTGTNIPAGAYIVSRTNSTTIVISVAATSSASGGTLTLTSNRRVDVTGYSAAMQVRKTTAEADTLASITQASGITLGGQAGTVALSISAATTGAITPGRHTYDLKLTSGSSVVTYLLSGVFEVEGKVTA
jgi:hypothetical protein